MRRFAWLPLLPLLAASPAAAAEPVPLRGLRAEVAALLVQGVAGGGLPIAAAVFPRPAGEVGAPADLGFLVEVPPGPAPANGGERLLEVYVYAVDPAGEVVGHFAVTLPEWGAEGEGIKLAGRLQAPDGELSLRFLAFDPVDRRYGMTVRRIGPGAGAAAPRLAEECARWVLAGAGEADLLVLSARPLLVAGETRRLALGSSLPAGGWRVRLVGRGEPAGAREVEARRVGPAALEFVVPELPPGVVQLTVVAAGGWRSLPVESWLVEALPPEDGGCRRSWSRVLRREWAREAAIPAPGGGRRRAARLEGDYLDLLARFAGSGDITAASERLAAREAALVAGDPARGRQLYHVELEAARALAERDPLSLLPLIVLHAETYRLHHRAGRFPLATHSRRLASAVAELAAESPGTVEEKALVAVALTGLAHMVERRHAFLEAQRLLERALWLDDRLEAARLLLAVSYDRRGRYADARRHLETLVSANSAHYEARVRLAILLRRLGDTAGAERIARAVVAERPPAWLLSLAYQTLGQLLIREARLGEAVAELDRAILRLPGDQLLHLLRAYALDRAGERRAARRALAELPPARSSATPRFRYSDQPAAALSLLHETLRQSVTVRLPVLAVALGAGASEEPAG